MSQAEARDNSDSGLYNPGANSYPYSPPYSYSSGVNSLRPQAEAGNGLYQRAFKPSPNFNYQQGKSSATPTNVELSFNQHLREPNPMLVPRYDPSKDLLSDLSSTYQQNPDTNSGGFTKLFQSIKKPYKPAQIPKIPFHFFGRNDFSTSQTQNDNEAYEPVPLVKPKDNYYTVPYREGLNSELNIIAHRSQAFNTDSGQVENDNNPYRAISILDSNPASIDSLLVPYREPSHPQTKSINYAYQSFGIPTSSQQQEDYVPNPDRGEPYNADTVHVAYNDGYSFSQRQTADELYPPVLRMDPNEDATEPSQSISRSELDLASNGHSSNTNTKVHVHNDVSDYTSASQSSNAYNTLKNRGFNTAIDNDLTADLKSKSDWTPYEYDPPSVPTPQLYPLGADKQGQADSRPAGGGVINPYSLGPYDYPSESPFRPGFNKATYEGPSGTYISK